MKWFTSDWHLGHANILKLGQGRPFENLSHMHSVLLENAWELVRPEDELWHLGDLAMGNFDQSMEVAKAFPGARKFLIPGNHDKVFPKLNGPNRVERFKEIYESAGYKVLGLQEQVVLEGGGNRQEVLLSHIPYSFIVRDSHRAAKLAFAVPEDRGQWLVHGHTHSSSKTSSHPRELQIGVDANDWRPVSELELLERILKGVS